MNENTQADVSRGNYEIENNTISSRTKDASVSTKFGTLHSAQLEFVSFNNACTHLVCRFYLLADVWRDYCL